MDFDQVWNIVLNQIQLEVSKVNFNTWFKNTRITAFNNGAVTIGSPNQFTRDWLEQKYDFDPLWPKARFDQSAAWADTNAE